jgi:tRNA A-37 threonylcarbamoyl transferase component Bud32
MGAPLLRMLDTGVRVLPQREWEERERLIYRSLRGASILVEADGTLVLPRLSGETLAALLENPKLEVPVRRRAIELAVIALAEFHRMGFTHGDAMAENVMIDLEAGVADWFDFETIHDSSRAMASRRADDVRALLATCLLRSAPEDLAEILQLILTAYADEEVIRLVARSFTSALRRPLTFHLGQAGLPFPYFREIARLLK